VHEEQRLYGQDELADHDPVRLEQIKGELDQVLGFAAAARRAPCECGQDPDRAKVRPASVVEGHKQQRFVVATRGRHECSGGQTPSA